MKLTIPRFDKARVLVVGDVMLDRYWHGATSRISPEAPVPVVHIRQSEDRAGGAGNVALNIAALGTPAWLIGTTGDDEAADTLETILQAAGVACRFIRLPDAPTITKLRVISQHQQLIRLDHESNFKSLDDHTIDACMSELIEGMGAVILSDYNKGTLREHRHLIHIARQRNIPVLVDPKGTDFRRYRGATVITPNRSEFEAVVGVCHSEKELLERGQKLVNDLDLEAILVTRSEQGMTLITREGRHLHLPARAKEVYDVTGAGDTVIAVLASALASDCPLSQAAALANVAAGVVVGKLGTATVSMPELHQEICHIHGDERGVVSHEQLMLAIENTRMMEERIVFTNGCFDIIHAGHVGYLKQARQQGDRLVVAINDDESVKRLKGEGRPINPTERRMAVLAGLESVDWVVSFSEDTPENLLKMIKPDVLVKGGDYTLDQVVGAPIVQSYGGSVKVLAFLDNCSTTAIVEKIREDTES
ncbi:Bifunctional protein HldE [invertebrate metagenome]|uniref:D-glycero-beta-D-manno-heptose 1-phosphate adenylyltransferase n=1 Tax=invertebrate metagenome TaxID=1711999 RepID=A0A2H9TCQ2_9ZZZZ